MRARRTGWLSPIMAVAFLLAARAEGQFLPPAPVDWQDISTPHFVVHHAPGAEPLAARLASIAEATYERYDQDFGLTPPGKVQVYLQEAYDVVNSVASAPLHLSIYVFPDPPYGVPHAQLGHYRDWLELAFVHEYMHIVDIELRRRAWTPIHVLTGLGYPNLLRPLWTIEGVAVWAETRLTGGGRIGSPSTEMVLRADVLEGQPRAMAEWSGAHQPWPSSTLSYLYGGSFFEFLEDRHGDRMPLEFRRETAGRWPWSYEGSLHELNVFAEGSVTEFQHEQQRKAQRALEEIRARGPVTEGQSLGRPGTTLLDILPTTSGVYVAALSDVDAPHLLRLDLASETFEAVTRVAGVDVRLSALGTDRLVFSDLDVTGNTELSSRFYAVTSDGADRRSISPARRVHEPAVSPDGRMVVGCRRDHGRSRLVVVDAEGARSLVTDLPEDADVFDPHWSPDGRQLVVTAHWQGRQDLWLVEAANGRARSLTFDEHWNVQPTFSPDGGSVAFASDRSGVWNVYALDLASGGLRQLTNVTTGAFLPAFSPDGEAIYFSRYTPHGDELRKLELASVPELDTRLPPGADHRRYLDRTAGLVVASTEMELNSRPREWWRDLRFLAPMGRLPLPIGDEHGLGLGVVTFGSHPLSSYGYAAMAGYGFDSHRVSYDASGAWHLRRGIFLGLRATDLARPTSADLSAADEAPWRRDRSIEAALRIPFLEIRHGTFVSIGGRIRDTDAAAPESRTLDDLPAPKFFEGRTVELQGGVGFDNAQRHPLSFSSENGVRLFASARHRVRALDGTRTGKVLAADLRGYLRVARPVVLAARAAGIDGEGREVDVSPLGDLWITGLDRTFGASRAVLTALEVRFRVLELHEKAGWDALYLNRVHGALFAEGARLQDESHPRRPWASVGSFGARASIDITVGYAFAFTFSLVGVVPSHGEATVVIAVGSGF